VRRLVPVVTAVPYFVAMLRRRGGWLPGAAVAAAAFLLAAGTAAPAEAGNWDRAVRLNQLQSIGSHNSYHLEAPPVEAALRTQIDPAGQQALEYQHAPLPEQFASQGVRQIELDVWADPNGWLYASPLIRWATNGGPYELAMLAPGTKVLHIQDIDYHSSCLSLVACLQQVKGWSDANRNHVPIAILLELKDTPINVNGIPFTVPVPWTAERMDALDAEIRTVFGEDRTITPDDVRAGSSTLEQAVLRKGWPTLAATRGQVMFLMDNEGAYRTDYLAGHDSLRGRVMFTNSTPGQPDAAFVKANDPTGANQARIADLVRRGYVVRTRADADTQQARTDDTTMRDAALASGAQWVSTDYPAPGMSARFGTDYVVQLPGGAPARCNPVNAPATCRTAKLERIRKRR
jgi:hypothetical protein